MDAWDAIVDFDIEWACGDSCNQFKFACTNFPKYLEYVETIILGLVEEKV